MSRLWQIRWMMATSLAASPAASAMENDDILMVQSRQLGEGRPSSASQVRCTLPTIT